MSTENLEQEIQTLDLEAKGVLDKLADRRVELERLHRETELAEEHRRQREEERRREEERERAEREHKKAVAEAERLGEERLALEERAEKEAGAFKATLEELLALGSVHQRTVKKAWEEVPEQLYSQRFSSVLGYWFRGIFKKVVPGIGHDLDHWESKPLQERDALTSKQPED